MHCVKWFVLGVLWLCPIANVLGANCAKEIRQSEYQIRIVANECFLQEILSDVRDLSGVQFSFTTAWPKTKLSLEVKSGDWATAVKQLLRGYNTISVWNVRRLSKVYILGRASQKVSVDATRFRCGDARCRPQNIPSPPMPPTSPPAPPAP